ncbi:MAG: transposase [Bdellovibrionales bacterium]
MKRMRSGQMRWSGAGLDSQLFFGGSLCSTRKHRHARPLSTRHPIHLVLRSSKAQGAQSFWHRQNKLFVQNCLRKYSARFGIQVLNCANVGNHLHLLMKLGNRFTYEKFIRAFSAAISLRLTKWNKNKGLRTEKFWDFRPYSRVVVGQRNILTMKDYISINQLEGLGCDRLQARMILAEQKARERV